MKVLNLYAGIGGNRKLWEGVEVDAVENSEVIADIYKRYFPNDYVFVDDAPEFLLRHYKVYDFIWASPPCPTHSRARFWRYGKTGEKPVYPDMNLYQIILFLYHHFGGLKDNGGKYWVVENVIPYYEPLIKPTAQIGRHYFWSNFPIGNYDHKSSDIRKLSGTSKKDKLERNKVDPEIGLYILNCARGVITKQHNQIDLFE